MKYGSVLGLRWGLLTDGRYLQVYDIPVTGLAPEDRLVLSIDLADFADRDDFETRIWPAAGLLAKSAMETGNALERHAARGTRADPNAPDRSSLLFSGSPQGRLAAAQGNAVREGDRGPR